MNTLTVKIPEDLEAILDRTAMARGISRSEAVREAIAAYTAGTEGSTRPDSALAMAGDLVGCVQNGPPDLATNPRYMDDYGED